MAKTVCSSCPKSCFLGLFVLELTSSDTLFFTTWFLSQHDVIFFLFFTNEELVTGHQLPWQEYSWVMELFVYFAAFTTEATGRELWSRTVHICFPHPTHPIFWRRKAELLSWSLDNISSYHCFPPWKNWWLLLLWSKESPLRLCWNTHTKPLVRLPLVQEHRVKAFHRVNLGSVEFQTSLKF